ncbi:MAG: methylated-DNA--[protein]-cysteine S-methyltransferase [Flavobacteriales bacterium]|nr:methylated-DNA--[protein]-cysteine S-methyltransferase [Flavobacteriales bacterium]MCB9167927.1 methylated-DNA--[protein]-cysteine S-methyltransferase [Flavobacteriales bacterium]
MAGRTPSNEPQLFTLAHVLKVDTPIGRIWVESDGELITRTSYSALRGRGGRPPKVLTDAARQMEQYFRRRRKHFELPLQQLGTRFQRMVWNSIDDIPFGTTRTYGQIGAEIGGRAIARTVGQACGSNPLPLLVPCHRVIAADGLLTGYVGGLWRKHWLLQHEGALPKDLFTK